MLLLQSKLLAENRKKFAEGYEYIFIISGVVESKWIVLTSNLLPNTVGPQWLEP